MSKDCPGYFRGKICKYFHQRFQTIRERCGQNFSHRLYYFIFKWLEKYADKRSGYGMVDALFNSMMGTFTKDFSSLSQVQFDDFAMRVKFNNTPRKSSAPVEIKISLTNERNQKIYFSAEAHSMVMASVSAICKAFEYLVNAERAVVCLRGDIEDASIRNRKDLSDLYINQMATLVRIVSYERVVKKNT